MGGGRVAPRYPLSNAADGRPAFGACSASDFNSSVGEFNKATTYAVDAFDSYNATISKALVDRNSRRALASISVSHPGDECQRTYTLHIDIQFC